MSSNDDYDITAKRVEDSYANANSQPQSLGEWLNLEIYVRNNQTELLTGLDQWLQLKLITQGQVKQLCRNHLSCALPEVEEPEVAAVTSTEVENRIVTSPLAITNILPRLFQGFLEELSIRWLLFLGIFLVVISSGVLAASQWQNFPASGQYLVLLVYTLGFWLSGFWTGKHRDLRLTSQTLKAIATLLVPVNFWAMSHLGLGSNSLEWIIVAVAAIILTITLYISSRTRPTTSNSLYFPLYLVLSYAHLAWQIKLGWTASLAIPPFAVYGGIGLISLLYYRFVSAKKFRVELLFILAGWLLLLLRGLVSTAYPLTDYCLAIAIFAWLIATISLTEVKKDRVVDSQQQTTATVIYSFLSKVVQVVSLILLGSTWLVTVIAGVAGTTLSFWQAVGISGLVIHLLTQRLTLDWRKRDLTAIFLIGLQTLYLSKELIPDSWRSEALDLSVNLSRTEYFPESVFSVTLFPYVILFVLIASWLYRREKLQLALYGEYLTLLLGIVLTCLSISNPTWQSLNLLLSTLTLGYVAQLRQRRSLVYLAHLLGLASIVSGIKLFFPNLTNAVWGSILIIVMAVEWIIYLRQPKTQRSEFNIMALFSQSCWYFGLFGSAASYCYFLSASVALDFRWSLVWLVTPAMLSAIAKYTTRIKQRRFATILSCIALMVGQLLVLGRPETRFIGLTIAVGLMFANAFYFRRILITIIHLGFVLSLIASIFHSFVEQGLLDNWYWLIVGGASILCLYRLRQYLLKMTSMPRFGYISQRTALGILGVGVETRNFKLVNKYIQAVDYWAIALICVELAVISLVYPFLSVAKVGEQSIFGLLTTILLATAIYWRYHQQPNNLVLYALTWLGSLFTVSSIAIVSHSSLIFSTGNICLGLVMLLVIERLDRAGSRWHSLNLSYVPLAYAGLGIFWRLSDFNSYTGSLTLGAAVILLGTRQREQRVSNITTYLGFAGISLGICELVFYRMQSDSGGSATDTLTILSLVAAAIAFSYRLLAWWYDRQQRRLINLSPAKIIFVAHIHWAISSVLKIIAAGIAIETVSANFKVVSIATSICLGAYAVIQGKAIREDRAHNSDWWVYVGLVEIAATVIYSRLIISRLSLLDPWRIVFTCAIALLIYQIPWNNFGWRQTPWQRTALILPVLSVLVTAEDVSYLSLLITAIFYLRIAYGQQNIRWSYLSLGLVNWGFIRLVWQNNAEFIWVSGIVSLSILYIAQCDPQIKNHYALRHRVRLLGSSVICIMALFYQPGIIPSTIAFCLIFVGLGLKIRAFLFAGTITLIMTAVYQLIILVLTYSFLKWVVGLCAGICSIAIAAGFEKKRDRAINHLRTYSDKLQNWQ